MSKERPTAALSFSGADLSGLSYSRGVHCALIRRHPPPPSATTSARPGRWRSPAARRRQRPTAQRQERTVACWWRMTMRGGPRVTPMSRWRSSHSPRSLRAPSRSRPPWPTKSLANEVSSAVTSRASTDACRGANAPQLLLRPTCAYNGCTSTVAAMTIDAVAACKSNIAPLVLGTRQPREALRAIIRRLHAAIAMRMAAALPVP